MACRGVCLASCRPSPLAWLLLYRVDIGDIISRSRVKAVLAYLALGRGCQSWVPWGPYAYRKKVAQAGKGSTSTAVLILCTTVVLVATLPVLYILVDDL